ncbi:probable xyloglucan galactosyltransferase GT17 [Cornus florida]|uniref:probable xyloglucan galactosyltransferase GT17 n=1 Tax=Cornus florida TaxID=4283 RepID=UPI0028995340|nr:probable xyloglucan galactosyltransferase GT17 [Cornus florida]
MSSRKHQSTIPSEKEKNAYYLFKDKEMRDITSVSLPNKKFFIFLSLFLSFWFVIVLFFFRPQSSNSKEVLRPVCESLGNISVYMYDLPPKFNLGLLQDCQHLNVYTDMCPHVANRGLGQPLDPQMMKTMMRTTGSSITPIRSSWFATHQFIGEMIFHARMENHPCRTMDPERANLFYVPFYGGLHASSKFREPDHAARDALALELAEIVGRQPWWQRHHGRDHFLALGRTAWDFMRTTSGPDFGANSLLNLPLVRNMSVLTVERHPWEGSKLNQYGIPYPSYFHPSTSDEMVEWQNNVGRIHRPHLFSFVGAPRKGVGKAAIRDDMIRQCAVSSRCKLLKCGQGASKCHEPTEVLKVMMRSQFCLQAPGDSFTRRSTFDSVLAGCIPVFFSEHTAYSQYTWYLPGDPTTYSVYMGGGDTDSANDGNARVDTDIEEELLKIPSDTVQIMRTTVIEMIPTLTYKNPNSSIDYGFPDSIDVALAALMSRLRDVTTSELISQVN